jgi:putative addiction module killer protein
VTTERFTLKQTDDFRTWFGNLRDRQARARIEARFSRLRAGNFGDVKGVGGGVSELRIHCGPGYRIYFARRGNAVVLLLAGGVKSSQQEDIRRAVGLAAGWDNEDGAEDLSLEH